MTTTLASLIINKLKKSSIWNGIDGEGSNIVLFSDVDVFPALPYVVVKPEAGIIRNTQSFRIIAHMGKGMADELKNYVLNELDSLLLSCYLEDEEGSRFKLHPNGYTDITPEKIDNSYFMERIYFVPMLIRD